MAARPAWPWHYFIWRPWAKTDEEEWHWATIFRRRGLWWFLKIYLAIYDDEGRWRSRTFGWFFLQNWPGFVFPVLWIAGLEDCAVLASAWLLSLVYGCTRFVVWLFVISHRWPPMAAG